MSLRWESKCRTCGENVITFVSTNMQHPQYVENALHVAHRDDCAKPDFVSFSRVCNVEPAGRSTCPLTARLLLRERRGSEIVAKEFEHSPCG